MAYYRGISVIIPTHGRSEFLQLALESTLKQQLDEDFEVILALDRPAKEVRTLIEGIKVPHLRTIEVGIGGVANAHNAALYAARYDLTAVMHADDEMLPNRLSEQSRLLRLHEDLVCVGGQILLTDEVNQVIGSSWFPEDRDLVRRTAPYRCPIAHPTAMYRTHLATSLGGYRQEFAPAEDYDLWCRMLKFGEIVNLPSFVVKYRRHANQISQQNKLIQSKRFAEISSRQGCAGTRVSRNLVARNRTQRMFNFDQALHSLAMHRGSGEWIGVFLGAFRAFCATPSGFMVYLYLHLQGRRQLKLQPKSG